MFTSLSQKKQLPTAVSFEQANISCVLLLLSEWNGTYEDGVTLPPYIHEVIKGARYSGGVDSYSLGGYTYVLMHYFL